jgi:hypothetical protein
MDAKRYALFTTNKELGHFAPSETTTKVSHEEGLRAYTHPAGPSLCGVPMNGSVIARTGPPARAVESFWPQVALCPECEEAALKSVDVP